jgi:hypothetical protein
MRVPLKDFRPVWCGRDLFWFLTFPWH